MENNTHLPAVLSFFAPGLGQLYAGKPLKFIGFYFAWSFFILMWIEGITHIDYDADSFVGFCFWIAAVVWAISLFDAYGMSKHD